MGCNGGHTSLGPMEQSCLVAWSSDGSMNLRYGFRSHEYITNIRLWPLCSLIRDSLPGLHTLLLILQGLALFSTPAPSTAFPGDPRGFFIRCLPLVCHSSSSCPHHLQTVYPSSFPWAQQASPRYSFLPTLQLPITAFHWAPLCLSPGAHNPRVQALGRAVGRMPIPCSGSVPLTRGREEPVDSFSAFPQPLNPKGYPKMGFLQLLQVQVAEPGICDPSLPVCSLLALVLCF